MAKDTSVATRPAVRASNTTTDAVTPTRWRRTNFRVWYHELGAAAETG